MTVNMDVMGIEFEKCRGWDLYAGLLIALTERKHANHKRIGI